MHRLSMAIGAHEQWARPLDRDHVLRVDIVVAVTYALCAMLSLEAARSLGSLVEVGLSRPWQYVWLLVPALTLVVRRVVPLVVLAVATLHLALTAVVAPALSPVFFVQLYYFFALFSAIAWARERERALSLAVVFGLVAAAWVLGDFVIRDGLDQLATLPELGPFPPTVAAVLQVLLSTSVFYLSAIVTGALAWWSARREAVSRAQAVLIIEQSAQLSERAVGEERLRIARELHDVVGHHIAVMGIRASAARLLLSRSLEQATEALLQIERSARAANKDLRLLLSALRARRAGGPDDGLVHGVADVQPLLESFTALGLHVEHDISGDLERVPTTIGLTLHRILQESLINVRRHSTADRVRVSLVMDHCAPSHAVELTVTDNGQPIGGTSGSQIGLVGMRERVELHHGTLQTSTTEQGGFQLAARLTWTEEEGM